MSGSPRFMCREPGCDKWPWSESGDWCREHQPAQARAFFESLAESQTDIEAVRMIEAEWPKALGAVMHVHNKLCAQRMALNRAIERTDGLIAALSSAQRDGDLVYELTSALEILLDDHPDCASCDSCEPAREVLRSMGRGS